MAIITLFTVAAAVALLLQFLYSMYKARQLQRLLDIPSVTFEHDDTQARYITSTKDILHRGYVQVVLLPACHCRSCR